LGSWAYTTYHSFWKALDLIFPPTCGGCGKAGSRWCDCCQQMVQILRGTVCEVCGLPLDQAGICESCQAERPRYRALRAWAVFVGPVQVALHKLKYRNDISLGEVLASHMLSFIHELNWPVDVIVPIPLGQGRLKERGYNQVAMIARPLALALDVQYSPRDLIRCKETRSQVGLTKMERRENVREAFRAGVGVKQKTVLVMDDVSTTGSTLSSSADSLYMAGAKDVYAFTVARALPHHSLNLA
jgi:competence protein ComFC